MAFTLKRKSALMWFTNPHNLVYVICVVVLVMFSAGAFAQSGNVYGNRSAQTAAPVIRAVILQAREVKVAPSDVTRYAGSAAGGALGGGIGYALGKKGHSSAAIGLVGAVLGGLGGAAAADQLGGSRAVEYMVQVPAVPGRPEQLMAITQPEPGQQLLAGDAVYLINTQGAWRVIKAAPAAPTQATEPAVNRWHQPMQGPRNVEVQFDERV